MAGAIMHHDYYIRTEIGRLCLGEAASGPKGLYPGFTDLNWEVAKQPVREIGLGLGDLALIAPAAFVVALVGGVARLNQKVGDLTKATVNSNATVSLRTPRSAHLNPRNLETYFNTICLGRYTCGSSQMLGILHPSTCRVAS